MNLIIELSNPDILPESLRTRRVEFGTSGGFIGRNQECDWVLDDPDRFVSSKHLRIFFKSDQFFVEDISTNGTYLNEELIGKGNRLPLNTGDVLRLGRFILSVEHRGDDGDVIGGEAAGGPVDLLASTSHGAGGERIKADDLLANPGDTEEIDGFIGENYDLDPMPDSDDLLDGSAPMSGVQDAIPVQRQLETSEAVPSDWMTRDKTAPVPAADPMSGDDLLSEAELPSGDVDDYGLTPVPPAQDPNMLFQPKPAAVDPLMEDPLIEESVLGDSGADVPPAKATAKKPAAKKAASKTASKSSGKIKKKAPAKKAEKKAAKTKTKAPVAGAAAIAAAAPVAAAVAAPKPAPEPLPDPQPIAEPEPAPVAAPAAEPAPVAAPAPRPAEPVPEDFGQAFAQAISLNPAQATGETGNILGHVLREMLEGSLDLIESRDNMRQELRLSGTMVGARENNPLKLSINYQDALGRMLQGESMGFKPPVAATIEVIEDLKRHQLGILAGIDAGMKALLDALNPQNPGNGKPMIGGLVMASKLAERHKRIREDTLERTDGVFWRAFTEAYKAAVASSFER